MMEDARRLHQCAAGWPIHGCPDQNRAGRSVAGLGASQGDFERFIVAPNNALDAFNTIPELFNLVDRCSVPRNRHFGSVDLGRHVQC